MLSAKKIREARELINLSPKSAGKAIGFPPEQAQEMWEKIESGETTESPPSVTFLIARVLGCKLADILE
jgi:hypothetical protein